MYSRTFIGVTSMDSDAGPNFSFFKPTLIKLKRDKKLCGGLIYRNALWWG